MPSILDRLIEPEPIVGSMGSGMSINRILNAVRRDLEDLLNTRQAADPAIEEHPELARSVFNYGLPDITRRNASTPQSRGEICAMVEDVIRRFEPRLKNVRATALDPKPGDIQTVRFEIRARLAVDPSPNVMFGTVLDLAGHAQVRASES